MTENEDVFIGRSVEQQGRNGEQRIEPASRLIDSLGNKLRRELLLEQVVIFKRIVVLREGHRTGVEPAVDNLRHAVHLAAALRALYCNRVDIGAVQLDIVRAVRGHALELFDRAYRMSVTALAFPDVERSSPVAVTADAPILDVLYPVAEASLADALGDPVDGVVVADEVVPDCGHFYEPRIPCIVDEGRVAAPAVGVAVFKHGSGEEKSALVEVNEHILVRILAELARPRGALVHAAGGVDELNERKIVVLADVCVVLTECRCDMDYTGAVRQSDITVAGDVPALFAILRLCAFEQRLILSVFKLLALKGSESLDSLGEELLNEGLRHIVYGAVLNLDFNIVLCGVDAERDVRGQSPRSCRPCEEICVLVLCLELDDRRALLDILIALSDLLRRERGAAARAVGHYLEALIEQALVPNLLERPPLRLDKGVVIGDVGVLHIGPEADLAGEILPHTLVFPYALLALLDKGLKTVFLYPLLALDAEQLLDLDLNGQTVGIPARLSGHHIALHGLVARDHVFYNSRQHVADMRLAVCGRRAVIESEGLRILARVDALLENVVLVPEIEHLLLAVDELKIRRYLVVHNSYPSFQGIAADNKKGPCP